MSNKAMLLLAALAAFLLAGCGGGSDAPTASGTAASSAGNLARLKREAAKEPATCRVGESALGYLPNAPAWWKQGPGPTLALACIHDHATGDAVIVGYSSPESAGGHCMNAYNLDLHWSVGEKCAAPGVPWNYWCEGAQGCVKGFGHLGKVTGLMGLLTAKVSEVKVLVRGKPVEKGVALARVRGGTIGLIGAEEPFGFFAAFIPDCVLPGEVKVELLGEAGSRIGLAHGWEFPSACPKPT